MKLHWFYDKYAGFMLPSWLVLSLVEIKQCTAHCTLSLG